jgi:hypothetical protein
MRTGSLELKLSFNEKLGSLIAWAREETRRFALLDYSPLVQVDHVLGEPSGLGKVMRTE